MCAPRILPVAAGIAAIVAVSEVVHSSHLDVILAGALITAGVICLTLIIAIIAVIARDHSPEHVEEHKATHPWHTRHEETVYTAEVIPINRKEIESTRYHDQVPVPELREADQERNLLQAVRQSPEEETVGKVTQVTLMRRD